MANLYRGDGAGKLITVNKFGLNTAVGTTTEHIWTPGATMTFQTAATTVEAMSTSTNDTSAGTGTRTIGVEGLDANGAVASATLTLNGTSETVPSTETFWRVFRAYGVGMGTYADPLNDGTITVQSESADVAMAEIAIGKGQTQMSHYAVPVGYTAYVMSMAVSVESAKVATVRLMQRRDLTDTTVPVGAGRVIHEFAGVDGGSTVQHVFHTQPKIPALTDLWAEGEVTAATGAIEVTYSLLLVDTTPTGYSFSYGFKPYDTF